MKDFIYYAIMFSLLLMLFYYDYLLFKEIASYEKQIKDLNYCLSHKSFFECIHFSNVSLKNST